MSAVAVMSAVLIGPIPAQSSAPPAAPRARELGVPFEGTPGLLNAITDVGGVEVGNTTLIADEGPRAVRTGVTVIFPKGKKWEPVFAGWFAGNGFGGMTGTAWVKEGGVLGGPIAITNTWSVGTVRDAVLFWFRMSPTSIPDINRSLARRRMHFSTTLRGFTSTRRTSSRP